jgi:hypothetical protein
LEEFFVHDIVHLGNRTEPPREVYVVKQSNARPMTTKRSQFLLGFSDSKKAEACTEGGKTIVCFCWEDLVATFDGPFRGIVLGEERHFFS